MEWLEPNPSLDRLKGWRCNSQRGVTALQKM